MAPSRKSISLLMVAILFTSACRQEPVESQDEVSSLISEPTANPYFTSSDGGEPRNTGYWLQWNSCAAENKAEVAAANGGREAGWVIMDDLLLDPGILMGELELLECEDGLRLLSGQPVWGRTTVDDAAYPLAAQLLAAQLNLAAAAAYCPASDDAVLSAQLLLIGAGFKGEGQVFGLEATQEDRELATFLTDQLSAYNRGELCR